MIRPTVQVTYPWKLQIGNHCWIGDHTTLHSLGEIRIGDNVCISQLCYLSAATHDYSRPSFDCIVKAIEIQPEVWLAAGVFVLPGVTVGRGAVVGARSVVVRDVPPMVLCIGNPAKIRRPRQENQPAATGEVADKQPGRTQED